MRRPLRHSRLAVALTLAVGLLTPMAANMVGAQAGAAGASDGAVRTSLAATVAAPRPRGFAVPISGVRPDPVLIVRAAERAARWTNVLVDVPDTLTAYARPRAGATQVGVVPAGSKYYGIPIVAWVETVSADGRWGLVELPYVWPRREGWIRLRGLARDVTRVRVEVDLSQHMVTVRKFGKVLFRAPGATGASSTPTPVGEYFVTDRVPFLRRELRHVRVRHQRHPASPAGRLDRREPARDPRHQQPLVDRSQRQRRLCPRVRSDARQADPTAEVRHTGHRARVAGASLPIVRSPGSPTRTLRGPSRALPHARRDRAPRATVRSCAPAPSDLEASRVSPIEPRASS